MDLRREDQDGRPLPGRTVEDRECIRRLMERQCVATSNWERGIKQIEQCGIRQRGGSVDGRCVTSLNFSLSRAVDASSTSSTCLPSLATHVRPSMMMMYGLHTSKEGCNASCRSRFVWIGRIAVPSMYLHRGGAQSSEEERGRRLTSEREPPPLAEYNRGTSKRDGRGCGRRCEQQAMLRTALPAELTSSDRRGPSWTRPRARRRRPHRFRCARNAPPAE